MAETAHAVRSEPGARAGRGGRGRFRSAPAGGPAAPPGTRRSVMCAEPAVAPGPAHGRGARHRAWPRSRARSPPSCLAGGPA